MEEGSGRAEHVLAEVRYATGYADDPVLSYVPTPMGDDGTLWTRTPEITRDGWLEVHPRVDGVVASVWLRNKDPKSDFTRVKGFTGEIDDRIANEIRFLDDPRPLDGPIRLPMGNFFKVYNGFSLRDGDLVMLELHRPATGEVQRAVFQYRAFGLRPRVSYAVLFRVPVPGLQPAETIDVGSLSFTVALSLGYSFRAERAWGKFLSDRVAAMLLAGVGSTWEVDRSQGIDDQVRSAYSSALLGAGIQVFDFVSLNFLFNPSSLFSPESQSVWAAAVGFDAVRFGTFTDDLLTRLIGHNALEPMDVPEGSPGIDGAGRPDPLPPPVGPDPTPVVSPGGG